MPLSAGAAYQFRLSQTLPQDRKTKTIPEIYEELNPGRPYLATRARVLWFNVIRQIRLGMFRVEGSGIRWYKNNEPYPEDVEEAITSLITETPHKWRAAANHGRKRLDDLMKKLAEKQEKFCG